MFARSATAIKGEQHAMKLEVLRNIKRHARQALVDIRNREGGSGAAGGQSDGESESAEAENSLLPTPAHGDQERRKVRQ